MASIMNTLTDRAIRARVSRLLTNPLASREAVPDLLMEVQRRQSLAPNPDTWQPLASYLAAEMGGQNEDSSQQQSGESSSERSQPSGSVGELSRWIKNIAPFNGDLGRWFAFK